MWSKTMDMRKLLISSALAVLFAMDAVSARADVVYSYTGVAFTTVSGSYTTSMKVTGSIDLTSALGANFGPATVTPNSFSFSDGLQTITNTTPSVSSFFVLQTGFFGNINFWQIVLAILLGEVVDEIVVTLSGDHAEFVPSQAFNNTAGSWSAPVSTVPLPTTLPLFATGLGALGLLGWRRKKKALAVQSISV
jgi:hypothetical protein